MDRKNLPPNGELGLEKKAQDAKISELPISDIMDKRPFTVQVGAKIYSTIQGLAQNKASGAPVVDGQNHLVGFISEYDLLMQAATRDMSESIEFMSEVFAMRETSTIKELIVTFFKKKYRLIPIIDLHKRVVGVVSRQDILNRLTHP